MTAPPRTTDIIILGGGVAALSARVALEAAGYSTILVSVGPLGAGQTILSQGILHSGVKYAFSAKAAEAARQLQDAVAHWNAALSPLPRPAGVPDLSRVRVLATRMHLWTQASFLSRFTGALGARAMHSGVRELDRADLPPAFAAAPADIRVWELAERAVDAASLVEALTAAGVGPILGADRVEAVGESDGRTFVRIVHDPRSLDVTAAAVVLAAGAGNEYLLRLLGADHTAYAQRRPLHMVLAANAPAELFGHCIAELSDKPRLTVTSSTSPAGVVWYLGGQIAESGVDRSESEQIRAAVEHTRDCLGWLDTRNVRWSTLRIDRAEGRTADGSRPSGPVLRRLGRAVALWPTKLVLAPIAAAMLLEELAQAGIGPSSSGPVGRHAEQQDLNAFPAPSVARAPWDADAERAP